ncbi:hypothetical protein PG985_001527 [Apiospora marii]|uniref:BTB domain-containing protein n=1 Tax=Apiospora marii TaxID=335849 RepID=A0ABR1RI65_9PEZI
MTGMNLNLNNLPLRLMRNENTPVQDTPSTTFNNKDAPIQLQVGERRFTTWKTTLTHESSFFSALLSGRWESYTNADGVLFVDADGTVFREILRYLRTGHYPFYFDFTAQSFDYAKYQTLLGEVRFFGIPRLIHWIQTQQFRGALEVKRETKSLDDEDAMRRYLAETSKADNLSITSAWGIQKIHLCPRGLNDHRGRRDLCWEDEECRGYSTGESWTYEEKPWFKCVLIKTDYAWDPTWCLGEDIAAMNEAENSI